MFDLGWRPKLYNKISTGESETSSSDGAIVYTAGGGGGG
jgi:hypothetical protein